MLRLLLTHKNAFVRIGMFVVFVNLGFVAMFITTFYVGEAVNVNYIQPRHLGVDVTSVLFRNPATLIVMYLFVLVSLHLLKMHWLREDGQARLNELLVVKLGRLREMQKRQPT